MPSLCLSGKIFRFGVGKLGLSLGIVSYLPFMSQRLLFILSDTQFPL